MQIKKYVAATLKEATVKMKEELGGDAIILGTRIIEGDQRFGVQRMFEISAGIDDKLSSVTEPGLRAKFVTDESGSDYLAELKKLNEKIYKKPELVHDDKKRQILEAIKKNKPSLNTELKEIVETLQFREIQKSTINAIVAQLKKYKSFLTTENIDSYLVSSIAAMIPTYQFELKKQKEPKVVSLVGPTGVGKTTCIAKLAVISKILHNLNIGLISIDTYRLGALDQLRIFSEISNTDMLVAYEPKEMPGLLNKFKKKDIIFIDTAGRSQNSTEHLKETKMFLTAGGVSETHLVLSSTSSTRNLIDVAEKFKVFNYKSVMFTKVDEAVSYGNMLNLVFNYDVPVMFLTNGQVIPDDIISADSEFIANMIYRGKMTK
ncbi:MAG: flagellar biosynthesis protein FlhF [Ignavibacteriaceae bacterium]|nr:flagellar biosynthesis protein FlhF [Ignavibacteriaceae bacterium]